MERIIGTIITVKDLYKNEDTEIRFGQNEENSSIKLKKGRNYEIPLFQREIRWEKSHLLTLITDVVKNPKFLGNIILTKKSEDKFEILDGQQRTTVIYMLLRFLNVKYEERFRLFETCPFQIQSYKGFSLLCKAGFDISELNDEEKRLIDETDDYKQKNRYLELWNHINSSVLLDSPQKAKDFLDNLSKCELNIIINIDSEELGIERFLDVNLKGVKLDCEDIFKGYLCSQDNSQDVHYIWSNLKKLDAKINPMELKRGKSRTKIVYPFMTIIEHYFRCKLSENEVYRNIEFDSNFNLTSEKEVESTMYSEGTHLIATICNKRFINNCLNEIESVMKLIESIVNSMDTSDLFSDYIKKYNKKNPKQKIENNECRVMHNLTKKILLDGDKAPKCMLIKYFLDVFLNQDSTKEGYRQIYAISSAGLMFSLFESKKDLTVIRNIIKNDDWYKKICEYINEKIKNQASSLKMIKVSKLNDEPQKFRSKSLATIYDFYDCSKDAIKIKTNKLDDLESFLNDETICTTEHFIVNESEKIDCEIENGTHIEYRYPKKIRKYKNALLNYIFISDSLNREMGNIPVSEKVRKLLKGEYSKEFENEKSEYSKMVVECVSEHIKMPELGSCSDSEEACSKLNNYFEMEFEDQFAELTKAVFMKMGI